jgi:hypothetical protein
MLIEKLESLRQPDFELEFARANLYIVIFKEISGSYDKVPYAVWVLSILSSSSSPR